MPILGQRPVSALPFAGSFVYRVCGICYNVSCCLCIGTARGKIYGGSTVTNLKAFVSEASRNVLCEPGKPVKFSEVMKPSDAAGFFSVGVKEAGDVQPSDHGIVVPGPVKIRPVND